MTLDEAEQAVIRAAIALCDRLYSSDVDHDDHGEQLGNVCLTVDALAALRLADAGGETWKPKPGDLVKFKGSTCIRKVIEYLASSAHELLVESVSGNGYIYANLDELEPVPEQSKAEESDNG